MQQQANKTNVFWLSKKQMDIVNNTIKKNGKMPYSERRGMYLLNFFYNAYTTDGLEKYLSQFSAAEIVDTINCLNKKFHSQ